MLGEENYRKPKKVFNYSAICKTKVTIYTLKFDKLVKLVDEIEQFKEMMQDRINLKIKILKKMEKKIEQISDQWHSNQHKKMTQLDNKCNKIKKGNIGNQNAELR